jgi:transcriptional regulator with XRE-family HTH domain
MKNTVGQKIKKLRELRNYTQTYMAIELDMTQQGYSKIEKEGRLTVDQLDKIAAILKVESAYILNFNEDELFREANQSATSRLEMMSLKSPTANDPKFYAEMIMLLRKEVDCLYALAFPSSLSELRQKVL